MKCLLFGGSGQLGYEIRRRAADLNFQLVSPVEKEVDITDIEQVNFLAKDLRPDVIINCAAYTAVDKAETDKDLAFKVNCDGASNIAVTSREINAWLIHISTDYVFSGETRSLVSEDSPTAPVNIYGESKLAGELAILKEYGSGSTIVRTSSLHGQAGENFLHTMLKLFREKDELRVVNDQFMCATWAGWLAEVVLDLMRLRSPGTVHACCKGVLTWLEFAKGIQEAASKINPVFSKTKILPISAEEFQRPARRPTYSAMDTSKLVKLLGREPITWRDGVESHLRDIRERLK